MFMAIDHTSPKEPFPWSRSMRCSNCSTQNPEGAKFCIQCATPISRLCEQCGTQNRSEARFCAQCAAPLDVAPTARAGLPEPRDGLAGERRHLTVLFCDLVGSAAMAARLDPEDWRETVDGYHRAATEAIKRLGGHVAQYLGDGVMAYFGWPVAHDNDPERAVRAGLAVVETMSELNQQPTRPKVSVRVGIDSGAVVVDAGGGKDASAFGDTPNMASRAQAAADPGTVLITAATHRLVSGLFVVEDRGTQMLKGFDRPIALYKVIQPSGVRGRLEAAAATLKLTPFVGREDKLHLLTNCWQRTLDGQGQVVVIVGEAGIGKSRLIHHFHQQIVGTPHSWFEAAAAPFFQNTPFYPVCENLREILSWRGDESLEEQIKQLESGLILAGLKPAEAIPLIAPLLNLTLPATYPPSPLSPERQRRRLLATLVEWVLGAAQVQPLVIATEDLHWADPSTLELIQLLVEQGSRARLLLLYTARPEFHAQWNPRAHHTQITLNRLTSRNARTMVERVAARKALSNETIAGIVERTGGVPLFVEELTRAVLESDEESVTEREIPVTLHDSLMARLDRLGPAKEVAQVGAVIGAEFSYELIHAVHQIAEEDLQRALHSLTDAELLHARGIAPDATYLFNHALIQDTAYEALLKSRRKDLHRVVARVIDAKFLALKEKQPEVLARHWTEAGEAEPALTEWQKAAERALERRAYREAEHHYSSALAVLQTVPASPERDTRELSLRVALGGVMTATRGWSAADTAEMYARARMLGERAGGAEPVQVFFGLHNAAHSRGEQRAALALADQLLEIARRLRSSSAFTIAHYAQAMPRYYLGDMVGARQHFRRAIELHCGKDFVGAALMNDPGFSALIFAGADEWQLGYPDQALRYVDDAVAIARRQNDPVAVAFTLSTGSCVYQLRGDFKRTLSAADEAARLATESGLPLLNALSIIYSAWARAQLGEAERAADRMRGALAQFNMMKFYLARSWFLGLLCEGHALAGAVDDALVTVQQALQTNPDELIFRPDLLRLRGELRLRSSSGVKAQVELAEHDFREAIEVARGMGARSLELRAAKSLARLLAKEDRRSDAYMMLAEIYGWFTEGFDTADLKDAKALLDELRE